MKLFISPHNDDEVLWGSYAIMRYQPKVLIVFDSYIQVTRGFVDCDWRARRSESITALCELGVPRDNISFLAYRDDDPPTLGMLTSRLLSIAQNYFSIDNDPVTDVWMPLHEDGGHKQHNLVSLAATAAFAESTCYYYPTYTTKGKSTTGFVMQHDGEQLLRKLKALACYKSQIVNTKLGCWQHFARSQEEYIAEVHEAPDGVETGYAVSI